MHYKHILVAVDGSEPSIASLQHAIQLAQDLKSKLSIIGVLELDPIIAESYVKTGESNEMIERARRYILDHLEKIRTEYLSEDLDVSVQLLEGFSIASVITQAAESLNVDLIMMGSHGRTGITKLVLGSVTQKVLNESLKPVLIVKAKSPDEQ